MMPSSGVPSAFSVTRSGSGPVLLDRVLVNIKAQSGPIRELNIAVLDLEDMRSAKDPQRR